MSPVNINGLQHRVGDWFTDSSVITWSNDRQAMRVLGDDNKSYTLSAKKYKESKSKNFKDFIVSTKSTVVRESPFFINALKVIMDQEFEVLDLLEIDLGEVGDLPGDLIISLGVDDNENRIDIRPDDLKISIARDELEKLTGCDNPTDIIFKVECRLPDMDISSPVANNMRLRLLPLELNP